MSDVSMYSRHMNEEKIAENAVNDSVESEDIKQDVTEETAGTAEESAAEEQVEASKEEEKQPEVLTPEQEALKWKDTALRTAAEMENYRKRMAREKQDAIRYANQRLLEELLPILDNFEMGMMAAEKEEGSMVYLGMSMVQKQLNDFLENLGVTQVATDGSFDPSLHDAVSEEETTEKEEGSIVRVMRRGFRLNDRLLRPATVVVAKAPQAEGDSEADAQTEEAAENAAE